MIWATYSIFKPFYSISIYCQPAKFLQLTVNLQKILIFSVSNNGIQWTLDYGPDSVTIAVNDLDQNVTISSQEITLAAWQLLPGNQRQDFLDNHLARVEINPNQDGTMEMRDEVLSSVGAQDMNSSSYQVSDLEDTEFNWENSQLETDVVMRPDIDSPFSPTTFDDLSTEGSVENPIVLDKEEDKEKAPPPPAPSTPECQTHATTQAANKSRFLSRNRKFTRFCFIEICVNKYYRVCVLIKIINNVFHFIINFFKN